MSTDKIREIGKHANCGGTVVYMIGPSYGFRHCDKCGANSMKGHNVVLKERGINNV